MTKSILKLIGQQCTLVCLSWFSEVERQPGSWRCSHSAGGRKVAVCALLRRRVHWSLRADCHCLWNKRADSLPKRPTPHVKKAAFPVARHCVVGPSSAWDEVPDSAGLVLKGPEKAFFERGAVVSASLSVFRGHMCDRSAIRFATIEDVVLSDAS